jgi:hypothetical protein
MTTEQMRMGRVSQRLGRHSPGSRGGPRLPQQPPERRLHAAPLPWPARLGVLTYPSPCAPFQTILSRFPRVVIASVESTSEFAARTTPRLTEEALEDV